MLEVAPTHETTFTTASGGGQGSGNQLSLTVLGNVIDPDVTLDVEYTIDQCDAAGYDGGTCRIVLHKFDLSTTSTFATGDYDVHDVALELSAPASAKIAFEACDRTPCKGLFSFETSNDNALTMALFWEQVNRRRGNGDKGALPIGNDDNWLGGIEALEGQIEIDPQTHAGELLLVGSGEDKLSGEFAAVSFALTGPITPK